MTNKVIVLEGPDCSGKSELALALEIQHGFKRIHTGRPHPGEDLFTHYTDLLMSALQQDQPIVFDRLHLGEIIYGPIMRNTDQLTPRGVELINRIFTARDVKLIICLPFKQTFIDSFKMRGDDYVKDLPTALKIYDAYSKYASNAAESSGVYNWETSTPGERMSMLFTPNPTLPVGTTGSPLARYLLVGDTVNYNVLRHDLPFHHLKNSSLFLHQSIELSRLNNWSLAFTNAYPYANPKPRDIGVVLRRLPNVKKIVAFGQRASKELDRQNVPHVYMDHPSYVKRFNKLTAADYGKVIKAKLSSEALLWPSTE